MRAAVMVAALGLGGVLGLLEAGPAVASAASGDALEVPLIELDVAVEDPTGRPLTSLRRDDFELFLDGEPVSIQLFQPPAAEPGAEAVSPSPLTLLIYVDPTFLEPGDLPAALDAVAAWLRRPWGDETWGLLATAEPELRLRRAPTRDLEALAAAVEDLQGLAGSGRAADEFQQIYRAIDRLLAEGRESNRRNQDHLAEALRARIGAYGAETRRELEATVQRSQRLTSALAGLPGRKVLLQIGGRLPLRGEQALAEVWNSAFGHGSRWDAESPAEGMEGAEQPRGRVEPRARSPLLPPLAESANLQGVTLYFLDASGLRSAGGAAGSLKGGRSNSSGQSLGLRGAGGSALEDPASLEEMAEATGGRALVRSRRFGEGLERWRRDLTHRYVLGFSPPREAKGYAVEVRFAQPQKALPQKAILHHRRSLRVRSADDASTERTLSALMLRAGDNPLEVEVALRNGENGKDLELTVQLPLANLALVADGRHHVGRISVFTATGGATGDLPPLAKAPVLKAVVPVRIANDELLTALGRRVEYRLHVPGGRSAKSLAVGVRDDFAPFTSTVFVPLAAEL